MVTSKDLISRLVKENSANIVIIVMIIYELAGIFIWFNPVKNHYIWLLVFTLIFVFFERLHKIIKILRLRKIVRLYQLNIEAWNGELTAFEYKELVTNCFIDTKLSKSFQYDIEFLGFYKDMKDILNDSYGVLLTKEIGHDLSNREIEECDEKVIELLNQILFKDTDFDDNKMSNSPNRILLGNKNPMFNE